MASVTLEKVWKIYNTGQARAIEAVRDVSLDIEDGEFIALLGPSGCGKTSILRMIAGLERISKGVIRIGNRIVNNLTPAQRNIAMAFETYALYPHMNVRENLSFCLRARKVAPAEIESRIMRVATGLHIEHLLDKRPSELPGGLQQLVSVGRAIIREPNVLLLDEPFSHIDASMRVQIRNEIKRLVNKTGTTAILVTHDQHEAIAMADRVVVMNFAEVQQVGTPKDLIHKPANMFVAGFVGEPAINYFPCNLIQNGNHWYLVCITAEGCFAVSNRVANLIQNAGLTDVIIGIRPQELKMSVTRSELSGEVAFFEFLGEEGHLFINSGSSQITVVTEPFLRMKEGEKINLTVDPSEIFIFDPKTERAICHGIQ
jgi:multiple sugar transport system ATP-binding protein